MTAEKRFSHPTPDQLEAWLEGSLPKDELRELEAHFAGCAECRELAADLRGFAQLEDPTFQEDDEKRILAGVRRQILADEATRDPFVPRPAPDRPVPLHPAAAGRRFQLPAWAAAALVLVFSGIIAQRQLELGRLERELAQKGAKVAELEARLGRPFANPFFAEARSGDDRQRSTSAPFDKSREIVVTVVAVLPEGTWRAVIENSGLPPISNLVPEGGQLFFTLPPGSLAPGTYQVRLFRGEEPWPQVFELDL